MNFNKLFKTLGVDLSGYGNNFKEMKSYTAKSLANIQFNQVQLPSDFFALLLSSGQVNKDNLGILYNIYANSHLNHEAKIKAFKDIEEFNYFHFSFEATKILKYVIEGIIKYPINTNEMKGLAAWIPEDIRTGEMVMDHKASLMKLVNLKFIHAFDLRILHAVFMNNSDIIKSIIEPGWLRILGLNHNYNRNKMPVLEPPSPVTPQRPSQVSIYPQPSGQDPSPVEQFPYFMCEQEYHQFVPRPYNTEIAVQRSHWSPDEQQQQQQQQQAITNFPTFQSQNIPIIQRLSSPNYELPSPPSMEEILREVQYDIPHKDVLSGVFPGECVIINIEKFSQSNIKDRIGSNLDVESIKRTFDAIGFHTIVKTDLTSAELLYYLKEKSMDQKLNKVGMFVCFLMSHGEEGRISGSDGENIEIDTIITNFKNNQCLALQGKPKVFFVQACRGSTVDVPKNIYTDNTSIAQPQDADLMICQATTKGKVAVRTDEGSWYINKLCEIIAKGHKSLDLMQIHTKVNLAVSNLGADGSSTLQVSNSSGSLRKTLRFVPNISVDDFLKKLPAKTENLFHRM